MGNWGRRRVRESRLEFLDDRAQAIVKPVQCPVADLGRDAAIMRLGDPAGDASERVGVAAERDGQADCALVVAGFEEGEQRRGYGPLAGDILTLDTRISAPVSPLLPRLLGLLRRSLNGLLRLKQIRHVHQVLRTTDGPLIRDEVLAGNDITGYAIEVGRHPVRARHRQTSPLRSTSGYRPEPVVAPSGRRSPLGRNPLP